VLAGRAARQNSALFRLDRRPRARPEAFANDLADAGDGAAGADAVDEGVQ